MASAVDFSVLNRPVGPLIAGPVDAISASLQQQQEQAEKEKLLQMRLDQENRNVDRQIANDQNKDAYYKKKLDLAEKRDAAKLTLENQKRRGSVEDQIRAAVGNGDTQLAQQLAARYQEATPEGEVSSGLPGFETKTHGGAPEPVPADAITAAMSNPVTQLAGMTDADINQARGPEAPPQAFQAEHEAWQAAPDVVALHGMDLSQDRIRHAAGQAAVQDFDQSVNAIQAAYNTALQSGDQQTASLYKRHLGNLSLLRDGVATGAIPLGKALAQAADPKADLAAGRNETALGVARIGAQGRVQAAEAAAGARKAAKDEETGGLDPKIVSAYEAQQEHFNKNFAVSSDRNEEARFRTLLSNGALPVVQRATASVLARGLAGEKGALSNQDVARLQNDLGGAWADVENWLSKKGTGQLSPEIWSALSGGLQAIMQEKAQKRATAEKAYERTFLSPASPASKWGMREDALNRFEAAFGHPYQPTKERPAAGSGFPYRWDPDTRTFHKNVDPSNPDDPNAPDAGRPLDGEGDEPPRITREQAIEELRRRGKLP